MLKTIIASVALAAVSVPALASDVTAEVRWGDYANQLKFEAGTQVDRVRVSGEVETAQNYNDGAINNIVSGAVALPLSWEGFTVQPFAQVGLKYTSNANETTFVGLGVKVSRPIHGAFTGEVSYRRREDVSGTDLSEDRFGAAVTYAVNKKHAVGVAAYNYSGTVSDHRYGVFYKFNF